MAGPLISLTCIVLVTSTLFTSGHGCMFGPGCTYQCHCQGGDTCNQDTGDCPSGCSDGMDGSRYRGPWSGQGCQLGNQAYGKPAEQGPDEWDGHVAPRAVDGHLNSDIVNGSCVHPLGDPGTQAWWEVDLGEDYVVVSVNITNLNQQRHRLTNTTIEVSSDHVQYTLCDNLDDIGDPAFIHVDCKTALVGRYVRMHRHPGAHEAYALNFCEVQVYAYQYEVCPYGYFGIACSSRCDDCPGDCEDVTGACLAFTPALITQSSSMTDYFNPASTTRRVGSAGVVPSTGATAGIAISVLCILAIIVLGFILCRRRDLWQKLRNDMQATILCGNGGKDIE